MGSLHSCSLVFQLPKPCSDAEASISDSHDFKRMENLEPSPWCSFIQRERKEGQKGGRGKNGNYGFIFKTDNYVY